MSAFFSGKHNSVGIDIGFNTLKVVELNKFGKKISIVGSNMVGIPASSVNKAGFAHKDKIASAIRDALAKAQPKAIQTKKAITALPESLIFSKIITVPKEVAEKNIEENVVLQISELLPWPASDTYFDWKMLPVSVKQDRKAERKAFVAASPKKLVDDFLEIIQKANLTADAIETKPLAASRALISNEDYEPIIILDIGAEHSSASVIDQKIIEFSSTIPIGANAVPRPKDSTHITPEDLKLLTDPLIENIVNNINYYNTRLHPGRKITQIRLCGGGSNLTGIPEILINKLGIKVIRGDASINFHNKFKYDPIALEIFTVAIGLALRELLP